MGDRAPDTTRKPTWSVKVSSLGEPRHARLVGDVVVVTGEDGAAGLRRSDGKVLWAQPTRNGRTYVTDDAFVELGSLDPIDHGVAVFDVTSGKQRFSVDTDEDYRVIEISVTSRVLLVHRCDDAIENCQIVGMDLRDGMQLWARPTGETAGLPYHGDRFADLDGRKWTGYLLAPKSTYAVAVTSKDGESTYTVLDAVSGAPVGTLRRPELGGADLRVVGDYLLEQPKGSCDRDTAVLDPRAQRQLWSARHCLTGTTVVSDMLLNDHPGKPGELIPLASGKPLWRTPDDALLVGVDSGITVSMLNAGLELDLDLDLDRPPPGDLVATDPTSGERLWRTKPARGSGAEYDTPPSEFGVADGRVAFSGEEGDFRDSHHVLRVLAAESGQELWRATDTGLVGIGRRWVVGVRWEDGLQILPKDPAEILFFAA
ncbi:MAG: PQQ-binding-like beta-propeller repeat protein [Micromonosporaceae bacterium]